jgi:hypothetical protein
VREIKAEMLVNWLHTKQEERIWTFGSSGEGVFMKKSKGHYACAPPGIENDGTGLYNSVTELNARVSCALQNILGSKTNTPKCAMTVNNRVIKYVLERTSMPYVQIQSGLRLQVIPDFEALPFCQRNQSAAFIASRGMLVVWQDDPKLLLERADSIINALMRMMCGNEYGHGPDDELEKVLGKTPIIDIEDYTEVYDTGSGGNEKREQKLWQSAYCGMSILLLTTAIGSGWRQVAIQEIQDPNKLRYLFLICLPAQVWLSLVCRSFSTSCCLITDLYSSSFKLSLVT